MEFNSATLNTYLAHSFSASSKLEGILDIG